MKVLFLLGLVALASARSIESYGEGERVNMIGYMTEYAIPLANEIRKAEEAADAGRITGGQTSSLGQFPYQAGLLVQFAQGQGVCGGSLINNRRVVTAAHCWFDGRNQGRSITVVLGSIRLFSGGTRVSTSTIGMHAQWNPSLIRNDVAVIYINTISTTKEDSRGRMPPCHSIQPISLPSGSEVNNDFAGMNGVASGFGRTSSSTSGAITTNQALSHVTLPIITNTECLRSFPGSIVASNICTSGAQGRSTCQGDSGGPLVVTIGNRRVLVGITSFGSARGCDVGFPAAFARTSSFMSFFNQHL